MQQRDEQVWALLLGKAWQRLDQRVICRLMCCSSSMSQLIHSTCMGRLPVKIQKCWQPPGSPSVLPSAFPGLLTEQQQQACLQGQWLARNCRLLSSLRVRLDETEEALLAEGLFLAAAVAAAAAAAEGTPAPAAAADGTALTDAAAAGQLVLPVSAPGAVAGLLLQSLVLQGTTTGSLLLAVAGSQQLTKLVISMELGTAAPEVQGALASLVSLQDLDFCEGESRTRRRRVDRYMTKAGTAAAAAPTAFEHLALALQSLTQLTRLELDIIPFRNSCVQPLPPSLRSLHLGSDSAGGAYVVPEREGLDLAHLTALTKLVIEDLQESDVLPGSLVKLRAPKCVSLQPVLGLQQLQQLKLESMPPGPELAQLGELCPALEAVDIVAGCHEDNFTAQYKALKQAAPHLPAMPLKKLQLWTAPMESWLLEPLSQCTRLTTLNLLEPDIMVRLDFVGAALQQLTSLQDLWIAHPRLSKAALERPSPEAPNTTFGDVLSVPRHALLAGTAPSGDRCSMPRHVLLAGIARIPSLRVLVITEMALGAAAQELAAATQLETLMLGECSLQDSAYAAQLESALGAAGVHVGITD